MKLQHIGKYVINPANIAFITDEKGNNTSRIFFNCYAACASAIGDSSWEMPWLDIDDMSPLDIMNVINNEPSF